MKIIIKIFFLTILYFSYAFNSNAAEKIEYLNLRYMNEVNEYFQIKKEFNL